MLSAPLILSDMPHSYPEFFPSRDSCPLQTLSPKTSTPSIYVTFKVLQLVNAFRKRVKTRLQNTIRTPSKRAEDDFCQEFERQAFDEIDRYLGRKPTHEKKRPRKSSKASNVATTDPPPGTIDALLDRLNQAVKAGEHSLTTVAQSEKLFVQRENDFATTKGRLSFRELTELLVTTIDLLGSISRNKPSSPFGTRTLCEGNELLDSEFNETFIANLHHLLLCLKNEFLRLLSATLVEVVYTHVVECQRDQSKHGDDWFFEFPDSRRPLSTTWPWSIRPSLAVLWGVCWMFYDYDGRHLPLFLDQYGNMVNEGGEIVIESRVAHHPFSNPQRQQLSYHHPGNPMPRQRISNSPHRSFQNMATAQPQQFLGAFQPSLPTTISHSSAGHSVTHAPSGLTTYGTNTPHAAYEAQPTPGPVNNNWLPEDDFPTYYQANAYAADVDSWQNNLPPQPVPEQQQQNGFVYAQALPPNTRRPLTPDIRVTIPNNPVLRQQPQDAYYSGSAVSSTPSIPPQDPFYAAPFPDYYLSPQQPRSMPPDQQQDMQTPPRSPHNAAVAEVVTRKRSHSDMSAGAGPMPTSAGSRSGSVISNAEYSEGHSPRGRALKREDPPTNDQNKYVCHFAPECAPLTFDRKCEWSKHMDKHDRPYRCPDPACAKLQGFTYSGGLLRHEREVHGKHGGPKAQLPCPYQDCKRHGGKGFTRKENLNEHIRRVHQSKDQLSQPTPMKRDATDAFGGAEDMESPADLPAVPEDHISSAIKRRRFDPALVPDDGSEGIESLKMELARLREEVDEKDRRLMEMELKFHDERRARDEEAGRLQETIRQLQQQS